MNGVMPLYQVVETCMFSAGLISSDNCGLYVCLQPHLITKPQDTCAEEESESY